MKPLKLPIFLFYSDLRGFLRPFSKNGKNGRV